MAEDIVQAIGSLIAKEQEFEGLQNQLGEANKQLLQLEKKLEQKDVQLRDFGSQFESVSKECENAFKKVH